MGADPYLLIECVARLHGCRYLVIMGGQFESRVVHRRDLHQPGYGKVVTREHDLRRFNSNLVSGDELHGDSGKPLGPVQRGV